MSGSTSRSTVRSVIFAILIIGCVVVVGGIGATVFFVRSRVYSEPARQEDASAQFERARARFAGTTPLIELASDDQPILHRPTAAARHDIHSLRALVYDPSKGTLAHMDIPAWLLRITSAGGRIRLANLGVLDDQEQRVTYDDLERQGPGVVLDFSRRGRRILVWTE
jgi:hypothetical protein